MVTLSLITCKRLDLFKKTINSFCQHCLDKELISHVILIDDNSSIEDFTEEVAIIRNLFPSAQAIYAYKQGLKGQAESMNFIWDNARTKYVFHLEDDWEFSRSGNFIQDGINVLLAHDNIKQSLLVTGGDADPTIYEINGYAYKIRDQIKHNLRSWPNFSLRPGIYDVPAIRDKVGHFRLGGKTTEEDYAERYTSFFLTAYASQDYCSHIGGTSAFRLNQSQR